MDNELEKLIALLTQLYAVHNQLLEIGTAMNCAIKARNLPEIQRMLHHFDTAAGKVQELEEERLACCDTLAASIGGGLRRHLTLTALLDLLPQGQARTRLADLRRDLKAAINALTKINVSNRILLNEGIQYIGMTVALASHLHIKFTNYKTGGAKTGGPRQSNLINRVV
ncbi:MAG: flagellar protein FlgN [Chitinivibrionales bacterium]|nr:flagellar protein FlgN [Chitinivibrionales bacterium]